MNFLQLFYKLPQYPVISWLKHAVMSFGCPTCPAFPPVIPQVSPHSPSSALLSHQISLNSACRTHGFLSFRGHCCRWGICLSSLWTLVAASPSPSLPYGTLLTSLLQAPSQWQHLAWPSDPEQAFLIHSRIVLIFLVIITNFSCDKTQQYTLSKKPTAEK